MPIQTILFDLDGTLLPMDQDRFIHSYFNRLATKMAPLGYEPKQLVDCVWRGTAAMIRNNGVQSNEQVFWDVFASQYGPDALKDRVVFDAFYGTEFQAVADDCGFTPEAARLIGDLKVAGYRLALATNPVFPAIATESRMRWAGLEPSTFDLYTTYENTGYCKPNLDYYRDILQKLHARPEDCLMVGNDVDEDMIAASLGIQVFLLTDCLINKHGVDLSPYPQGSFAQLRSFLQLSDE